MRRLSIFLLLAAASSPALAAPDDDGDRAERRAERRAAASEQAAERPQRAERAERAQSSDEGARVLVREHRALQGAATASGAETPVATSGSRRSRRNAQAGGQAAGEAVEQQAGGGLMPRQRRLRTVPDTQPLATQPGVTQLPGSVQTRHRRDYRDGNYARWSNNWRNDRRYDWRRYRDRNRSIFRLGFYYDPFGYSYRRFNTGFSLWPSHYSSRYWLNDPWQYRLPPAYGPYRWVRYWNDALLVNIYTGEVVDVMHGFFW